MKTWLSGAIGLMTLGALAPATAADFAPQLNIKSAKAPAYLAPIYDWTGFYLGVFGGGGESRTNRNNVFDSTSYNGSGGIAGVTAGYNWQTRNVMLGAEADIGWTSIGGRDGAAAGLQNETHSRWLSTIRGRVGVVANQWLFFGTGGLAIANLDHTNIFLGVPDAFSVSRTGWTAGAGAEYALTPNWSAKLEYRHFDFDAYHRDQPTNGAAHYTVKSQFDTVTAGVNYKWGGPLVAKY
jgi:outer membrane immunogenic protein